MKLERKELAIGAAVFGGAFLIYVYARPKEPKPVTIDPTNLPEVARASNSSDANAPIVSGGGFGGGLPESFADSWPPPGSAIGVPTQGPSTAVPESSPVEVYDPLPQPIYVEVFYPGDGEIESSPAAPSQTYTPPTMPSYFTPGFVPIFGSPLWALSSKGYRLIGPGSNSVGNYNTWEFWYPDGSTKRGNFYTSGAKKGTWVGPF